MALTKLCLGLCLLLLPISLSAATLAGKTTVDGEAAAGITVMLYPQDVLDFGKPAPYHDGPTGEDGQFSMEVPMGQYYLMARGEGRFAYYGRNPITVADAGLEQVNLLMELETLPVPSAEGVVETGVSGIVTNHGEPVAGAVVMVYPDLSSQLKGLGLGMSAPTGADGLFELPLPEGKYYLVVRVRKTGQMAGPLKAGDLFGYFSGNPLVVKAGQVAPVHIPVITVPDKVERYAESLFGNTVITGRVLDATGAPVAGLQALLYDDPMMLNRPLYVSQPTGTDGTFILSFPKGGHYYLSARNTLGGTPSPGDLYGRYQGSEDHSVQIETGETLEGVEIKVEEVY